MVKFWWVSLQFYTSITPLKMVFLCSPDWPTSQVLELWCIPPHLPKFVFIISSFSLFVVFCGVGKEAHGLPQVIAMLCTADCCPSHILFFFPGGRGLIFCRSDWPWNSRQFCLSCPSTGLGMWVPWPALYVVKRHLLFTIVGLSWSARWWFLLTSCLYLPSARITGVINSPGSNSFKPY